MLCLRLAILVWLLTVVSGGCCYAAETHEALKAAAIKQLNLRMDADGLFSRTMTSREKSEFKKLEKKNNVWEADFLPGKFVMYLDLAYGDGRRGILTTAVHRRYRSEPPLGVSFTVPKGIDREQGIVLAFAKKKGNKAIFKEADALVAGFSSCDESDCSYRLAVYDNKGRDADLALKVLTNMMKFDYLAVGFMQNHQVEVVNFPLSYYRDQYLQLSDVSRKPAK